MHALALHLAVLAAGYSFTVDGRAEDLPLVELSGGAAVVEVHGVALWLDEPRAWAFAVERDGRGNPLLVREGPRVVGAVFGAGYKRGGAPALAETELAQLRGVAVDRAAASPALKGLRPERACATVTDEKTSLRDVVASPGLVKKTPALPRGLACVVLRHRLDAGKAELPDVSGLRHLGVDPGARVDVAWLGGATRLESVRVESAELLHPEALPALARLRVLDVTLSAVPSLAGEFPALERLRLVGTQTTNLAGLHAPRLAELEVQEDGLAALPAKLPALARAVLVAKHQPEETFKAFVAAHPGARIERGWAGLLRHVAGRADRLRVRAGGLCHRQGNEPTLFATAKKDDVAALLVAVAINEDESDGTCMCCGGPTVELYEGSRLVAAVSLQHGDALRWRWFNDAVLADDRFVRRLAAWGVGGPLEEWKEHAEQRDAELKRLDAYLGLMPVSIASKYRGTVRVPFDAVLEQLDALVPEGPARFEQHLRLYGSGPRRWDTEWGLDRQSSRWLAEASVEQLAGFAAKQRADLDAGLARLMFSQPGRALVDEPALAAAVPRLAMVGLSSPYAFPRRRTFAVLGRASGLAARQALRGVLAAPPPPLPEGKAEAPELLAPRSPDDREVFGLLVSEQAIAALLLAQKKDAASADAIRAFCRSCRPIDASLCKDALLLLDAK